MAVYFLTGKLGSGKSLAAVGRIREYIAQGRPVATNLDINLVEMFGAKAKKPVVYRLPDKPSIDDFEAIGTGNNSYDESRNGLVVLDECGTWFNSRTWGDKERQAIINWFLHARKKGWDLIFIVQSIAIVDKQARLTLAEHVVYCRRLDKLTVPFISTITKLLFNKTVNLPRVHYALVKYGDQPASLIVDRWVYLGRDLYRCYDTKQAFSDFYEHSTYQLLPPWLSRGRYMVPMTWRNAMRITKIHWKRFSRPIIGGLFFALGVAYANYQEPELPQQPPAPAVQPEVAKVEKDEQGAAQAHAAPKEKPAEPSSPEFPIRDRYAGWQIDGYMTMKGRDAYMVRSPAGVVQSLDAIAQGDVDVMPRNNCHVRIVSATNVQDFADLYRLNCIPDDAEPVVTNAIDLLPKSQARPSHPTAVYIPSMPSQQAITSQQLAESFGMGKP
ncbi:MULTISPECIES: zonular occludens toxin domain-containing protein, partial [unclassified Pseudomonas]|uniref:zonular occludens toxin domain-containing protein n=1 Tax=unclassified Pseudomonas TaxID=196821 RepID=UPI00244C09CE